MTAQGQLSFTLERKPDQCARLLAFFQKRAGEWIPLPEILNLHMSQFGARIFQLRRRGYQIENKMETVDGQRHSWYRLSGGG